MPRILIVDDEPNVRFALREVLEEQSHDVVEATTGEDALRTIDSADVVITDLSMPGMDGLTLLERIHERHARLPVVVLTARGSERAAVRAMKAGALDYLTKPFEVEELRLVIARALELTTLRHKADRFDLERAIGRPVVGDSPAFQRVLGDAERVADREIPVLVTGETGTGKELLASVLHFRSRRASKPFIRFNCAAISPELAEAELFGHAKGAFTGANAARSGFFKEADGGTLVLDEVGDLPLNIQGKLLRAVQEGEIQPIGTAKIERVDVRIVACTHRDLKSQVATQFREDLYYRLAVVELRMPALRERTQDIVPLALAFAARYAERFGIDVTLADSLLEALRTREWPGNVRELENTVARLVALSEGGILDRTALGDPPVPPSDRADEGLRARVDTFERELIERALADAQGNRAEAARRLRIPRVTLVDRIKKLGIE